MNNIKSFNEYTGQELERVVYDNEITGTEFSEIIKKVI